MATELATQPTDAYAAIVSYHVHTDESPFCKSWSADDAEDKATLYAMERGLEVEGPYDFTAADCPYRIERDAAEPADDDPEVVDPEHEIEQAISELPEVADEAEAEEVPEHTAPTASVSALASTSSVDLHDILCDECGEPMDRHSHPNAAAASGRSSGPRKKASEHPQCPHCGGRIHWNDAGGKVNFECLLRQRLVERGDITDPLNQKLPVSTAADIVDLGNWINEKVGAGAELRYGKMESTAGGAPTYSALRPKAPPKPRKAAASIEQVAGSLAQQDAEATALGYAIMGVSPAQAEAEKPKRQKLTPEEKAARDEARKQERANKRKELLKGMKK